MFFIPLNQPESVTLVVHALRAAAGQADCSICPVRKVCERQCLAIAASIEKMLVEQTLPQVYDEPEPVEPAPQGGKPKETRLTVVK